jgi:class 3 adenylate cyclase
VGLNSGQVIAGEIGSGSWGYTAIGERVGMAQRMESVASPGGVMFSASTGRLVDGAAAFGEAELVQIKGVDEPVQRAAWITSPVYCSLRLETITRKPICRGVGVLPPVNRLDSPTNPTSAAHK